MARARRFNWEAALVPCWGFLRRVPIARGLSLAYPFLVIAVLGTERTLFWSDLAMAFGAVGAAYALLLGMTGDWMLRRARAVVPPESTPAALSAGRIAWHAVFSSLVLTMVVVLVIASIAGDHKMDHAVSSALKSDLLNLSLAQESYHRDHGRFAPSLDSLEFMSSSNVTISIVHADASAWAAEASHPREAQRCRISVGRWAAAPPDSLDGWPLCDEAAGAPGRH